MGLVDKQKKIIEVLQKEGECATTKIAFLISSNLYQTEFYLNDLLNKNILINESRNSATYWKLRENDGKEI